MMLFIGLRSRQTGALLYRNVLRRRQILKHCPDGSDIMWQMERLDLLKWISSMLMN